MRNRQYCIMYIVNVLRPKKKSTSFIDFFRNHSYAWGALELSVLLHHQHCLQIEAKGAEGLEIRMMDPLMD